LDSCLWGFSHPLSLDMCNTFGSYWLWRGKNKLMYVKTLLLGSTLAFAAATALAQGTVNFANIQGSLNAPVYHSDGTTKLSGSTFIAELLAGTSQNNLTISVGTTGFLPDQGAGYFSGGTKTVNGIAGGATAWIQLRFWNTINGSSFASAQASGASDAWGSSAPFTVVLGNPLPARLDGLNGQELKLNSVPEPSALALVGLGLSSLLFRRR
jgi:hypothetical protein